MRIRNIGPQEWKTIARMAAALATVEEISAAVGVPKRTLYGTVHGERFRKVMRRRRAVARYRVRQQQLQQALHGPLVSAIWWGKQHLGQSDRRHVEAPGPGAAIAAALLALDAAVAQAERVSA